MPQSKANTKANMLELLEILVVLVFATKNLSIGEGGMLITNNKNSMKTKGLSLHGMDKAAWNRYGKKGYRHYDVSEVGYKYNLMDLLSAIGIIQLKLV